jgi:hypothetical protein
MARIILDIYQATRDLSDNGLGQKSQGLFYGTPGMGED